ncbi:hypothetical protein PO124_02810 [Bacillus licheniformis]|nr:hypothetical protein [Bacillus licheniformis]
MSTVSMSIVGAYMTMLKPEYVVTALVLNLFGGFIIASIINPYEVDREHDMVEVQEEENNPSLKCWANILWTALKSPSSWPPC